MFFWQRIKLIKFRLLFLIVLIFIFSVGCYLWNFYNFHEALSTETNIDKSPIGRQYDNPELFRSAIEQSQGSATSSIVSGVIIPHHLLAKQLIADTLKTVSLGNYQEIVLLSPDHFYAGKTVVSVSERNFSTVFGEFKSEPTIIKALKRLAFVSEADFFYREHGLQAPLPFIKYYFPQARIIAITFRPDVSREELDAVVDILKTSLSPNTLVVQSTDFSHYLTPTIAAERDTETLAVLAEDKPEQILALKQPANIDSLAAAYVQAKLQHELFKSKFIVLSHHNSQDYTSEPVISSTSYLSAVYIK